MGPVVAPVNEPAPEKDAPKYVADSGQRRTQDGDGEVVRDTAFAVGRRQREQERDVGPHASGERGAVREEHQVGEATEYQDET